MAEKDLVNKEVKEEQAAVEVTENVTEASENEESTVNGAVDSFIEDTTPNKSKKKGIIIAVAAVILVAALAVCGYFIYQTSKVISLVTDTVTVEYGETYKPDVADFVEESEINDTYTITGEIPNEDEKEYPAIGEYTLVISADGKDDIDVTVIVADTIAPVFAEDSPTEISTYQDVEITEETLNNTLTAADVDEITFSIDDSEVDYTTAGTYTATVYAFDASGNTAEQEITVTVKEPTISIEQANVSLTVGETATLNTTGSKSGCDLYFER